MESLVTDNANISDVVDSAAVNLSSVDTPDACNKAALRLRGLLCQLQIGEVSADVLQRNLQYAARVLEAVFIDEARTRNRTHQAASTNSASVQAPELENATSQSGASPATPSVQRRRLRAPVWARRLADEDDELSEVQPDAVPPEVREWLASTFTRQLATTKRKADEKPKFRSVAHAIRAGIFVDRMYRRVGQAALMQFPSEVARALKNLDDWAFDVFVLNEASAGQSVKFIGYDLLNRYGIIHKFKVPPIVLEAFLVRIEEGYCRYNNPYHNNIHAADVSQTVHFILCRTGLMNWMTDLEIFATLVAALIHDFEHTGTTNNFHVMSGSHTALLYNDRAVLENHHLSSAFQLLKDDECNIAQNLSREEYREFRTLIIDMVLATDMSFHFQQLKNMRNLISLAEPSIEKSKALSLVLHTCDISHPSKQWNLHKRWTSSLLEEFFRQGDMEKELGLPFSPLCDRNNTLVAESQIGFIEFIVEPSMLLCWDMLEAILAFSEDGTNVASTAQSSGLTSKSEIKIPKPWIECLTKNKAIWKEQATKDNIDAVYIPPEVDELTDEEVFEEGCEKSNENLDIVGTFEVYTADDDLVCDDSDDEPLVEKRKKLLLANDDPNREPIWKVGEFIHGTNGDFDKKEKENIARMKNELEGKTPLDLFFMFFDDEMLTNIIQYTQKYALDNNRQNFTIDKDDLLKFLGIMILSGYHTLPQADLYWSTEEDKGLKIVKDCMSRNRFRSIKRNIHLSDNSKLDKKDKFTKLRPFFELLNKKFMQFGIFSTNLSIDEQMVPYFGRHSCKMYLKGKPVRFGFKLWCLCSSSGFLYQFIPYAGASTEKSSLGLGGQVVLNLLSVIEDNSAHMVYFDNFFSSYKLFSVLTSKGYSTTGTIRDNRTLSCPLETNKVISKKQRGSYSSAYDENTGISLVRWNDNSVVTMISNCNNVQPVKTAKRYNRKEKRIENISQPAVIAEYNKFMGGVDLHDNAIANYRTRILGKKWWWPLFSNAVDSAIVNAWKIFNIVNEKTMSQLEFKSYIAYRLLKFQSHEDKETTNRVPSSIPNEMKTDGVGHVIIQEATKARRRCRVCHSATIYMCKKCNVHVHANCFEVFHKK